MALALLGPVAFDIKTDLQTIQREVAGSFAKHDIMGGRPAYEWTGEDETTFTLSGTVHPYVLGGLEGLALLELARLQHVPLPLMRGNGTPMGWVLIRGISLSEQTLDPLEGIGQEIEHSVKCVAVSNPGIGMAESILRLFMV